MIQTIKDIYNYRREDNSPMLSPFEPAGEIDFWKPYRDNFEYFDRLFMKKYRSWFPMDQEGDIEEVAIDFAYDVKSWLMINDKRYSELYRIQTITDDEKYSLTDNVYETESISKSTSNAGTFTKGSETISDSGSTQYGAQSDSESKSAVHPQYSNSESKSTSYGSQLVEVDGTVTQGSTSKQTENSTSAYNSSTMALTDRKVETDDPQTETTNMDTTHGAHTDTETNSYTNGAHTDTEANSYTHGAHTDTVTNTRTDSSRSDSSSATGTETMTRNRAGNIGVKDVPQMLGDQKDFWSAFSFYDFIFDEIARDLLRGC